MNVCARQTGKTTRLCQLLSDNYQMVIMIVRSQKDKENVIQISRKFHNVSDNDILRKIFTPDEFHKFYGSAFSYPSSHLSKLILIDDYLFFTKKQKLMINDTFDRFRDAEIVIETTSDKLYDPNIVMFSRRHDLDSFLSYLNEDTIKQVKELDGTFLSNRDCMITCNSQKWAKDLTKERLDTEIYGKFWQGI